MLDKHIGEIQGELTIVALSNKNKNGYLNYYWTKCSCGNIKRYRYDQIRKNKACGLCEDYKESNVNSALKELERGKE